MVSVWGRGRNPASFFCSKNAGNECTEKRTWHFVECRYLESKNLDEDRGGIDMTDNVKKELELHVRELQHSIDNIVSYADTTEDVVKMNFESIRLLVDYCEGLSLEGEPAMTRWRREKFKEE